MIVKLKCVDNEGYDYFTVGKVYNAKKPGDDNIYYLRDDENEKCAVSVGTYIRHGKWEVINE